MFTQNTPVSRILATVSLVPSWSALAEVAENITCGGVYATALKKEYGAKLSIPSLLRVDTQPIGRGDTIALNGLWGSPCPLLGS